MLKILVYKVSSFLDRHLVHDATKRFWLSTTCLAIEVSKHNICYRWLKWTHAKLIKLIVQLNRKWVADGSANHNKSCTNFPEYFCGSTSINYQHGRTTDGIGIQAIENWEFVHSGPSSTSDRWSEVLSSLGPGFPSSCKSKFWRYVIL